MDKKIINNKRFAARQVDKEEDEVASYKNQNVIFKIHSGKGQQNYSAKTFPAKFSINICNEAAQLMTGQYNRDPTQSLTMNSGYSSPKKILNQSSKLPKFDFEEYDRQIRVFLEDKKKCDNLILQLQQTCQQYQKQNQDLLAILNQKDSKIHELEKDLIKKDKSQIQLKELLFRKQIQAKDLQQRIRQLQKQLSKLKKLLYLKQNNNSQNSSMCQKRILELQAVILQKQQTIKNLSNFNNEICNKILEEQSQASSSHVKQMEKWLKILNKKYQKVNNLNGQNNNQKGHQQANHTDLFNSIFQKNQKLIFKITQLQKINEKVQHDWRRALKQNQNLMRINEQLNRIINQLQRALDQKQFEKQTQQTFYKKTLNSNATLPECGFIYEGTVKVKMEYLLLEKDKRIHSLQQQLQDAKKQNLLLRTKLFQLDCEQQLYSSTLRSNQGITINRIRSASCFHRQRHDSNFRNTQVQVSKQKQNTQICKIMNQCNNLTNTLQNFMENCKTQRLSYEQDNRKFRNSQDIYQYQAHSNQQNDLQKIKQLMNLQRSTFQQLQKKLSHSNPRFEQTKWNSIRNQQRRFSKEIPATDRIFRQSPSNYHSKSNFKRSDKSSGSYFINQRQII